MLTACGDLPERPPVTVTPLTDEQREAVMKGLCVAAMHDGPPGPRMRRLCERYGVIPT